MSARIVMMALLGWLCPMHAFAQSASPHNASNGDLMLLLMFAIVCFGSTFAAYLMAKRKGLSMRWVLATFLFCFALLIMAFWPNENAKQLVSCPLCHRPMSSQAKYCPSCGHPNAAYPSSGLYWLGRTIESIMLVALVGMLALIAFARPMMHYLTALPTCSSAQGQKSLKDLMDHHIDSSHQGLTVIDLDAIENLAHTPTQVSCKAVAFFSDGTKHDVTYQFYREQNKKFIHYEMEN
ncbi:hypothetical protein COMNV_00861 [Commensalibacter sp. Nvir]|uniref:zinc ribbon domain-containing protein n=1 Tax=Commensalibacter sp. Nvir TaxID=3069817 RepID=UPI002D294E8E|nr:hypothetical protein COMNV_00861 [Commensalibacter sp. Nvir]